MARYFGFHVEDYEPWEYRAEFEGFEQASAWVDPEHGDSEYYYYRINMLMIVEEGLPPRFAHLKQRSEYLSEDFRGWLETRWWEIEGSPFPAVPIHLTVDVIPDYDVPIPAGMSLVYGGSERGYTMIINPPMSGIATALGGWR